MKTRLLTTFMSIILLIGLFSCEMEDSDDLKNTEIHELKSHKVPIDAMRKGSFFEDSDPCYQELELWYDEPTFWGAVLVYKDGEELVIKIQVDEAHSGWGIFQTWLVFSDNNWGENQPKWTSDPNMMKDYFNGDNMVELRKPFQDFMEDGCFYMALKVLIRNGDNIVRPRAYFNFGGDLVGTWNEELCLCKPGSGTGTPGYWKNHPEAWVDVSICDTDYTPETAIPLMKSGSDKSLDMFTHLICAKLNVEIGNPSDCISEAIIAAEEWLCNYGIGSEIKANSSAWQDDGEDLKNLLDDYNNGRLCADHRD